MWKRKHEGELAKDREIIVDIPLTIPGVPMLSLNHERGSTKSLLPLESAPTPTNGFSIVLLLMTVLRPKRTSS